MKSIMVTMVRPQDGDYGITKSNKVGHSARFNVSATAKVVRVDVIEPGQSRPLMRFDVDMEQAAELREQLGRLLPGRLVPDQHAT